MKRIAALVVGLAVLLSFSAGICLAGEGAETPATKEEPASGEPAPAPANDLDS